MDRSLLILLDRDGVVNRERDDFVKSIAEFEALPGSLEAIARLSRAGHRVGLVTNQSGVGRGLLTRETLDRIHERLRADVADLGGRIDHIEVCPHLPDAGCLCRKPAPTMLARTAEALGHDSASAVLVGDRASDLAAADAFGCPALLVRTGRGRETERDLPPVPRRVFDDLRAAAHEILTRN